MPGTERYTEEQTYTTPASLEAMAKKLDEIDHHVRTAATTALEARDCAKESRDFAKQSSEHAAKLVAAQALPASVKIAAIIGGAALGGGGVTLIFHLLHVLIA